MGRRFAAAAAVAPLNRCVRSVARGRYLLVRASKSALREPRLDLLLYLYSSRHDHGGKLFCIGRKREPAKLLRGFCIPLAFTARPCRPQD